MTERTPEELAMRRIRQVAFGLLAAALVADAAERLFLRWRLRINGAERLYLQRMESRGATPAELGRSLLEATSARR